MNSSNSSGRVLPVLVAAGMGMSILPVRGTSAFVSTITAVRSLGISGPKRMASPHVASARPHRAAPFPPTPPHKAAAFASTMRCSCAFSSSAAVAGSDSENRCLAGTSIEGRVEEDAALWPAPPPSQLFVAVARNGARYEHDVAKGAKRIRAVISDLDGTLLDPNKRVSERVLQAVRRAREKGVVFIPASGRSSGGMFSAMGELGDDLRRDGAPFVSMNGLTVFGQGKEGLRGDMIHSTTMCPLLAARVVDFWKTHPLAAAAGISLCGSQGEAVVVEKLDARTQKYVDWKEPSPLEVGDFNDAIAGGLQLNRLYFWGPSRDEVDAFKDDLDQHLVEHPAELTRGVPEMIEVLPPGASKAVGVDALLKHLGISPEEVIALGDEENDVEMLRAVGYGIAMGQAAIGVRRAAQFTAPTNELDGVAVALETFCGI